VLRRERGEVRRERSEGIGQRGSVRKEKGDFLGGI